MAFMPFTCPYFSRETNQIARYQTLTPHRSNGTSNLSVDSPKPHVAMKVHCILQRKTYFEDSAMPKTKASISRKKASEKAHEARGYGSKARIRLDFEKLRNAGWTIEERQTKSGSTVHFKYRNPDSKTIKSAREVERQLEAEGTLCSFIMDESKGKKSMETPQQADDSSLSDGSKDSDYEPPEKQAPKEIKATKW